MAQRIDINEIATFKELLMANSIQVDAAVQLLKKGGFSQRMNFSES